MPSQHEIDQATRSLTKFQRDLELLRREAFSADPVDDTSVKIASDIQEKLGSLEEALEVAQQGVLETRLKEVFSDRPPPTSDAHVEAHLSDLKMFSEQLDELLTRLE